MRKLGKLILMPATVFILSSCGSSDMNIGDSPVYPPAPPPPFRYDEHPIHLFSSSEADFTCITDENKPSEIKCWGDNSRAQVNGAGKSSDVAKVSVIPGIPTSIYIPPGEYDEYPDGLTIPIEIQLTEDGKSHALAVGKSHACVALSDRTIRCWGDNIYGQLDNNLNHATTYATTQINPSKNELSLPYADVRAIAAGATHTCAAFDDEENDVWCWGDNSEGQVSGDGIVTNANEFANVTANAGLPRGRDNFVVSLSAGHNFTCAIYEGKNETQSVWCWGNNNKGQVTGKFTQFKETNATKATQIMGLPTGKITSLAAGYDHACVGMKDGNVWCWGNDQNAQVSGIKDTHSFSPGLTLVQGIPQGVKDGVLSLTTGKDFTCAAFKNGELWCWGDNANGAVDAKGLQGATAQRITNVSNVSESVWLAAGANHTCAAFTGGEVKCWGNDNNGQVNGAGDKGELGTTTFVTLN